MRMGKASRTKQQPDRRARIAAQREAERRRGQRRRIYLAGGSVLVVAIIAVAFVLFKNNGSGSSDTASNGPTGTALASVVKKVTSVPAATLDKVASGGSAVGGKPLKLTPAQSPLVSGGKPEMLYMGAEYCPYCAAERWGMIVALSRFGTFSGLATVHSAAKNGSGSAEPYPNTPTWTFAKASYTSPYLVFNSVEENTNIPDASTGGYTTLQTPTSAEAAIIQKYDYPPFISAQSEGSIPFIDFGNKYEISGASYSPQVLAGKSWATIATALSDPSSPIAQGINGTANYMTAAICSLTGNKPTTACTPTVQTLETAIAK
jgi:hypothetical protein